MLTKPGERKDATLGWRHATRDRNSVLSGQTTETGRIRFGSKLVSYKPAIPPQVWPINKWKQGSLGLESGPTLEYLPYITPASDPFL